MALLLAAEVIAAAGNPQTSEFNVIRTYNVRDIVVTLLGAAAEWTTGENHVVLEFDSATRKRLIDIGVPKLTAILPTGSSRGRGRHRRDQPRS